MSTTTHASGDSECLPKNVELLTFIGGWNTYIGVDEVETLFYLIRTPDSDGLEVVTHYGGTILSRQCPVYFPREGSVQDAATRLLNFYVRSRINYECPVEPHLPGLLSAAELQDITRCIAEDLARNSSAAEQNQLLNEAPILTTARQLGLQPRPAGHNAVAWLANCPREGHWIMISTSSDEFGCGYCGVKGRSAELRSFACTQQH